MRSQQYAYALLEPQTRAKETLCLIYNVGPDDVGFIWKRVDLDRFLLVELAPLGDSPRSMTLTYFQTLGSEAVRGRPDPKGSLYRQAGERIPRIGQASDSLVGDCIHQIFSSTDMQDSEAIAQLVSVYQLQGHLTSVEALQRSWSHFVEFLRAQYGEPLAQRHELPFKQQVDGQIITGSIDMLWETAEGVVLIDFKTYSGTTQQLLDPTNPHYAGRYKGQLDCYQRAIEASGQRVLDQLIFYPILGDVVRLLPLD